MSRATPSLLFYLRTMVGAYREDARSDAELLDRFVATRDETAFATMAARHGPMVWRICRRILADTQDAEDACQVVFLALANNAQKIHITKTLAGWLQQVAHRTALDARKAAKARYKLQERLKTLACPEAGSEKSPDQVDESREVHEYLHGELAKLPEKLRVPLVLHYLEGKTQAEVSGILGVSEPTVWKRLVRAKSLLQNRLTQRGLTVGAAAMGTLLAETASKAALPAGLIGKTVRTAIAYRNGTLTGGMTELAKQVLKQTPVAAPWWMKGWLVAILCAGGLGLGAGGAAWRAGYFGVGADETPSAGTEQEKTQRTHSEKSNPIRLDFYGDSLPDGAVARIGTLRFRPADSDSADKLSVVFGSNGRTIFSTAGYGGSGVSVWETATGKKIRQIDGITPERLVNGGNGIAISPDGRKFVVFGVVDMGPKNGPREEWAKMWSWDLQGDSLRLSWKIEQKPQKVAKGTLRETIRTEVHSITFSPDGKTLACRCSKNVSLREVGVVKPPKHSTDAYVCLRDAATGKELRKIKLTDKEGSGDFMFSPDGKTLALRNRSDVTLWSVATGDKLYTLKGPDGLRSVAFSPDGAMLAMATRYDVLLWDVATGLKDRQWRLGRDAPPDTSICYLPDGKTLLATGKECVHFFDPATGAERRPALACPGLFPVVDRGFSPFGCERGFKNRVSPDGRWLASFNGLAISVWDLTTGKQAGPAGAPNGELAAVAFSPDGKMLATDAEPGVVQLWDAANGKLRQRLSRDSLEHTHEGWGGLRYADDGRLYTVRTEGHRVLCPGLGALVGWDARSSGVAELPHQIGIGSGWAVSPNGRLAAVGREGEITLCETATGKEVRKLKEAGLYPYLAFSEDGRSLLAFKIIGKSIVNPSDSGFLLAVWDVASGRRRLAGKSIQFDPPAGSFYVPAAISPDGRWLAACTRKDPFLLGGKGECNGCIQLWETASGAAGPRFGKVELVRKNSDKPLDVWLKMEGHCLAIASPARRNRPWGAEHTIEGTAVSLWDSTVHPNLDVLCLAFSPDGRTLAAGGAPFANKGEDKLVWILDLAAGQELRCFSGHRGTVQTLAFTPDGSRLASGSSDGTALIWDIQHLPRSVVARKGRLKPDALWAALAGADAIAAYCAIGQLGEAPEQAIPLLRQRLQPSAPVDAQQMDQWLTDLNSDRFEVRSRAYAALKKCGPEAEAALQRDLKKKLTLETRRRLEELIGRQYASPQWLSMVRGIEVLERIGTPPARRMLKELARPGNGTKSAEAQAALQRLAKQRASRAILENENRR